MNNIVTVEVFNADGSLAQREEKHNYITEGFLKNIEASARQLIFGGVALNSYRAAAYEQSNFIALTNNSDAIDTTDGVFTDALVGLSYTNSSTVGAPLGGVRNSAESYYNNGDMKIVIDFATDRANGTFQSVHLCAYSNTTMTEDNNKINGLTKSNFIVNGGFNSGNCICSDATYLYVGLGTDEIYRFNKSTYAYVDKITLASPVSGTIYDIETDGTHFYITSGTSGNTIYKYTLAGAQVTSIAASNCYGITLIGGTLYYNNSSGTTYTIDTGLVGPAVSIGTMPFVSNRIASDGTNIIGNVSGGFFRAYSTADASVVTIYGNAPFAVNGIDFKATGELYSCGVGLGVIDYSTPYNVASRARLDSPVTKNNTQTMKVTYDFNFS